MTIKIDQIADVLVNAPGSVVSALSYVPTGTVDLTSTSFVDLTNGVFQTVTDGQYMVMLSIDAFAIAGTPNYIGWCMVFDRGTSSEQTIGPDDSSWRIAFSQLNVHQTSTFTATANLSSGTHTVYLQWKAGSGGSFRIDQNSYCQIGLIGTGGSGAGGTINTTRNFVTGANTTSGSWTTVNDGSEVSVAVTTATDELVFWTGKLDVYCTGSWAQGSVGIGIDGADPVQYAECGSAGVYPPVSVVLPATLIATAGSHTLRLMWRRTSGSGTLAIWSNNILRATQYRGGLVPIQKDGAQVIDKPQAINFTGPGCQVTNIGGTATVNMAGTEGIVVTATVDSGGSIQTISTVDPTFTDIVGMSLNFTTATNEYVGIAGEVGVLHDSGFGVASLRLLLDGTTVIWTDRSYSNSWIDIAISCMTPALSAGSHTVKLQAATAGTNFKVYGPGAQSNVLTRMQVTQFRGGYTLPDNIPVLEYNSASQIHLHPAPGAASTLRAALNDGKIYTATAPLVIDLTVSGRGGLDTGSEASSTWYYAYLVPTADGTGLSALCSVTGPATGPTGYSVWRYVGAFRNDGSSNIIKFYQVSENKYEYATMKLIESVAGTDGSPVSVDVSAFFPASASKGDFSLWATKNSTTGYLVMQFYSDGEQGTPASPTIIPMQWGSGAASQEMAIFSLALPSTPKKVWRYR